MDIGFKSFRKTKIYVEELYPHRSVVKVRPSGNNSKRFRDFVYRYIQLIRNKKIIRAWNTTFTTQGEAFQDAMKLPLLVGQCIGLFPVVGILSKDPCKVRFEARSLRMLYNAIMCLLQTAATILCLYKLLEGSVTVRKLGNFAFYLTTSVTSIIFLQLATKWKYLLEQVKSAKLDEYIDPSVKFKCFCATLTLLASALIEHMLVIIARVSVVTDCNDTDKGIYAKTIEKMIYWIFDTNVTYHFPMGIVLLVVNFISTINWSYSHIFIICISLYLTSLLERINERIKESTGEYYPSSHWRKLREDYNRATDLIRTFDDVISSIIFFSFSSNLFFVCLQLFNTLSNVMTIYADVTSCPHYPSGIFHGYELLTYFLYSLFFLISRFLAVAQFASRVHTASLAAAPYLYSIPSTTYCSEVQRFIQQIQGNFTALSGLNYFYITKELILSIAGTIVTYELVLLQIDN